MCDRPGYRITRRQQVICGFFCNYFICRRQERKTQISFPLWFWVVVFYSLTKLNGDVTRCYLHIFYIINKCTHRCIKTHMQTNKNIVSHIPVEDSKEKYKSVVFWFCGVVYYPCKKKRNNVWLTRHTRAWNGWLY